MGERTGSRVASALFRRWKSRASADKVEGDTSSLPVMVGATRERITLDLRGLGPSVRAHAKARSMTVSAVARLAVVKMLGDCSVALEQPASSDLAGAAGPAVKVTVRILKPVANELALRARAAGLSHGAYVSTLIAGKQVLQGGVDRKHAVRALIASTDQLALVAADLSECARLARRGTLPSSDQVDCAVAVLAREVRAHLGRAARLMADLQPVAAARRAASQRNESSASPS